MNRLLRVVVVAMVIGAGTMRAADGAADQHGARFARLSDQAKVGLIVDQLRAAAAGSVPEGIARQLMAPQVASSQVLRHGPASAAIDRTDVGITGTTAVVNGSLRLTKSGSTWSVTGGSVLPALVDPPPAHSAQSGESVGETFIPTAISSAQGIDRLSRGVTESRLDRKLFSIPARTASYYAARYRSTAPFVTATYIQFVVDPEWNRIVYGNLDRGIKAYGNLRTPTSIAVDASGRVFVGEEGAHRISVLRVSGEGTDAVLQPLFVIEDVRTPSDLSLSDNGTPLDVSDDLLYVADASRNIVVRYALGASSATVQHTFEGFDSPSGILAGRWDGVNNHLVYVIDRIAKRVRVFEDQGNSLAAIGELQGTYYQYFSAIRGDHFGNVYLIDQVHADLRKYTSSLEFLDAQGGDDTFAALSTLDIPFGTIDIEGQGTFRAGFDQVFAIERWSESTGAQRRILGLKLKDVAFSLAADGGSVDNSFVLTDMADLAVTVYDANDRLVRSLDNLWMVSGRKAISWDRRDDAGRQVAPGAYRYEISAKTAYRDDRVVSRTRFTLPMYYYEDCGSQNNMDDAHLVQGSVVRWGSSPSETANENAHAVQYHYTGLDPEGTYAVSAEYASGDGVHRLQDMTAGTIRIHDAVNVGAGAVTVPFTSVPKEAYRDGELTISVNSRGEGTAIVSQLWLKQSGIGLDPQQVTESIPTAYSLEQNYPNPFNPSTVIRYALPADGHVSLRVFDINGREVATLVDDVQQAGVHEARFDAFARGRVLASGVYFYQVKSGSFTQTRKMALVK